MDGSDTKMTLQTTPPHIRSMSAISQLLRTRFWWNFKGRFLGTFRTDSSCQGDICPCNICPLCICPYQEYLSCYWPDFDKILKVASWEYLEQTSHSDICLSNICPGDNCPYQQNLSFYWPDFDGTLKVAYWEHLEQIPTIKLTFVQATFVLGTFVHIRNISAVADPMLTKL